MTSTSHWIIHLAVVGVLTVSINICFCQTDIADARTFAIGSNVTVSGIATNGDELGFMRYLQDTTGGIAAYPGSGSVPGFSSAVERGDHITVTGKLVDFNGLLEISPITNYYVHSNNNDLPLVQMVPIHLWDESYEAELITVSNLFFADAGGNFVSDQTYEFTDGDETGIMYIRSGHPLVGMDIPSNKVNLTGILSQFGSYQLLPRDANDMIDAADLAFTTLLEQTEIGQDRLTFYWETNLPAKTRIGISDLPNNFAYIADDNLSVTHEESFDNLQPAQVYYIHACSEDGTGNEICFVPIPVITASQSGGQIEVYFNHAVDPAISDGSVPHGQDVSMMINAIINKIDEAEEQVLVCEYNCNEISFITALEAAHQRGVEVKYIYNIGTQNPCLEEAHGFQDFGVNEHELMHNKFVVIDANLTFDSWVISGSLNWTSQNINSDYNNVICIQDESLARTYRMEFEEMWGGAGPMPDSSLSAAGGSKTNNTPHHLSIGGVEVESYFSPSDQTTFHLQQALMNADQSIDFALLSFTKDELGAAIAGLHHQGVEVRGIIEAINDTGGEFYNLAGQGIDVRPHSPPAILHHKYAIIDGDSPGDDPVVITGSHNWSQGAESDNDENTLIVHHPGVANIYLQEFTARFTGLPVDIEDMESLPALSVWPNPFTTEVRIKIPEGMDNSTLHCYSENGQYLSGTVLRKDIKIHTLKTGHLPIGHIVFFLEAGDRTFVKKALKKSN